MADIKNAVLTGLIVVFLKVCIDLYFAIQRRRLFLEHERKTFYFNHRERIDFIVDFACFVFNNKIPMTREEHLRLTKAVWAVQYAITFQNIEPVQKQEFSVDQLRMTIQNRDKTWAIQPPATGGPSS